MKHTLPLLFTSTSFLIARMFACSKSLLDSITVYFAKQSDACLFDFSQAKMRKTSKSPKCNVM